MSSIPNMFQTNYIKKLFKEKNLKEINKLFTDIDYFNSLKVRSRKVFLTTLFKHEKIFNNLLESNIPKTILYNNLYSWVSNKYIKANIKPVHLVLKSVGRLSEDDYKNILIQPEDYFETFVKLGYKVKKNNFLNYEPIRSNKYIMKESVIANSKNIAYDKTNDPEVYDVLIKRKFIPTEDIILENDYITTNLSLMENAISKEPLLTRYAKVNDESLYELAISKGYKPTTDDLKNNPCLQDHPSIIKKSLDLNITNIKYDKSKDHSLYVYCLEKLIEKEKYEGKKDTLENVLKILNKEVSVEEGTYAIPFEVIYDAILEYALTKEIEHLEKCYRLNGYYKEEYAKELETLYNDPSVIVGVHGSPPSETAYEKFSESVFKKGLFYGVMGKFGIEGTVHLQIRNLDTKMKSFLDILDYCYPHRASYVVVVVLPKGAIFKDEKGELIPTMHVENNTCSLATEFIYGTLISNQKDTCIKHNPNFNKVKTDNLVVDEAGDRIYIKGDIQDNE